MRKMTGQRDFDLYYDYALIARENYYSYKFILSKREKLIGNKPINWEYDERSYEDYKLGCEVSKYSLIMLVFSSLSLEAYLYTLGVELLGKNNMKKIERHSKSRIIDGWTKVLYDGFGYNLQDNDKLFQLLKKLSYTRNWLVHVKSREHYCPENQKEADKSWNEFVKLNNSFITPEEIITLFEIIKDVVLSSKNDKILPSPISFNDIS